MAKAILHIGTHKTGTSTIQRVFARNRSLLKRYAIIYPSIGCADGHHGLIAPWVNLPGEFHVSEEPDGLWRDLADTCAGSPATLFLSSEEFSRATPGSQVDFKRVRALLAPFERVEVLSVLRDQASYLQSIYIEVAKRRAPPPWEDFFKKALATNLADGLYLDYNALYDRLLRDFSPEEICFVSYNDASTHVDGLIGYVLQHIDAGISPRRLRDNISRNVSPNPLAAWIAANAPSGSGAPSETLKAATLILREVFGKGAKQTLYTRAELAEITEKYRAANATLESRLRGQRRPFRMPEPLIGDTHVFRDQVAPEWMDRARARLQAP